MAKWRFRSCPRCDGDIFIDKDLYGWFEQCLQCGYNRNLRSTVKSGQRQNCSENEKEKKVMTLSKE